MAPQRRPKALHVGELPQVNVVDQALEARAMRLEREDETTHAHQLLAAAAGLAARCLSWPSGRHQRGDQLQLRIRHLVEARVVDSDLQRLMRPAPASVQQRNSCRHCAAGGCSQRVSLVEPEASTQDLDLNQKSGELAATNKSLAQNNKTALPWASLWLGRRAPGGVQHVQVRSNRSHFGVGDRMRWP